MGIPCVFSRLQSLPVDPTPGAYLLRHIASISSEYLEVTRYTLGDRSQNCQAPRQHCCRSAG